MKKAFILIFIFVLGFHANSQITVKPGVRAGLNLATLIGTDLDFKADFYVGGLVAIKFAKFYTMQPEINYSRQGAKGEFYDVRYDYDLPNPAMNELRQDRCYSLQYLNFNLINKFYIVEGFHASVGPSLDVKLYDNFDGFNDDIADTDIGFNLGLGYTTPIGITIESRIKFGMLDIFGHDYEYYDNNDYYSGREDVVLNTVMQMGLSYTF
jgi:hypothetical protein